jgi:hypothetical protein
MTVSELHHQVKTDRMVCPQVVCKAPEINYFQIGGICYKISMGTNTVLHYQFTAMVTTAFKFSSTSFIYVLEIYLHYLPESAKKMYMALMLNN